MKEVTKDLINDFNIYDLGYDFMGCNVYKNDLLDFHHLLIPRRECAKKGIPFDGYIYENGSILKHGASHQELHLIEIYDYNMFLNITSEMQDMKVKGWLDPYNLKLISEMLSEFEYENMSRVSKKGKRLIKNSYLDRHYK